MAPYLNFRADPCLESTFPALFRCVAPASATVSAHRSCTRTPIVSNRMCKQSTPTPCDLDPLQVDAIARTQNLSKISLYRFPPCFRGHDEPTQPRGVSFVVRLLRCFLPFLIVVVVLNTDVGQGMPIHVTLFFGRRHDSRNGRFQRDVVG
jgi:hypothetical protein